jgi:uncharacterized membrane protein
MADREPLLPSHIEDTIRSIARLHADHHRNATRLDRVNGRLTEWFARPGFVVVLTLFVAGWIGMNLLAIRLGFPGFDPPPFPLLGSLTALASLYMVALVLATQRRDDQLALHREQLTLELAILGERKTAKVIQLLEEVRRDNPMIHDRIDPQAEAMAEPADPQSVLEAIHEIQAEVVDTAPRGDGW